MTCIIAGGPRKLDFPFRVAACYDKIIFLTYVGARFTHMDFYVGIFMSFYVNVKVYVISTSFLRQRENNVELRTSM